MLDYRIAAMKAYSYLSNLRKVSKIFSVAISTLSRWNRASRENISHVRKQRSNNKASDALVAFIRHHLEHNPFLTRKELKTSISDVFGISVSTTLVGVSIHRAGMTRKMTHARPSKPVDVTTYKDFLIKYRRIRNAGRHVVSIDETGFDDSSLPHMGYSRKGCRLVIKHSKTSWRRTSAVAAISSIGTRKTLLSERPVNGDTFLRFLGSLDIPSGSIILMDNIAFHKTQSVKTFTESKGWELLFTPPYSPWFNPIENVFSVVKHSFRGMNVRDENDSSSLQRIINIHESFETATAELITACFMHVDEVCRSAIVEMK